MTATASLIFGDGQSNVYVVNITDGSLAGTIPLPLGSGSVSNKPLVYNGVAYCPTTGGLVCGIVLSSLSLSSPAQLSAAINAPPVLLDSRMLVASADGYLTAFDISGSAPTQSSQGSFLPAGKAASTVGWVQLVPSAAPACPALRDHLASVIAILQRLCA